MVLSRLATRATLSKSTLSAIVASLTNDAQPSLARDALLTLVCLMQTQSSASVDASRRFPIDFTKDNLTHMLNWPYFSELVAGVGETYDLTLFARCFLHSALDAGFVFALFDLSPFAASLPSSTSLVPLPFQAVLASV